MKKFLILLIFNSISTIANVQMEEDNCTNCKAIFPNTKIENIVHKSPNISNENIATILKNALKKIQLYKEEKNSEIKRLNSKLESVIKEFTEYKMEKDREISKLKSELAIYRKKISKSQEKSPPSTWVEIVVEDGVDIFQLALKYYGDRDKYEQIYLTNTETIGEDLQIKDGMSLKIPIIEQFEEKPMFINMD